MKKIHRAQQNTSETKIETNNRYGLSTNETNENSTEGNPSSKSKNLLQYSYMVLQTTEK